MSLISDWYIIYQYTIYEQNGGITNKKEKREKSDSDSDDDDNDDDDIDLSWKVKDEHT